MAVECRRRPAGHRPRDRGRRPRGPLQPALHRRRPSPVVREPRPAPAGEEFWALRHVSFKLVHGESLGVIGPNGAGKSTLLQVLAGIIQPSEGAVDVRGQVSSLLTLGAGFDPELTGRENILLAGAFLGLDDRSSAS